MASGGGAFAVSGSAAAYEQIHSKFTANAYLLVGVTVGVKFNCCTRKRGKLASTVRSLLIFYFMFVVNISPQPLLANQGERLTNEQHNLISLRSLNDSGCSVQQQQSSRLN